MDSSPTREIPEEVSCPICECKEWVVLNRDNETIRLMGLDWARLVSARYGCFRVQEVSLPAFSLDGHPS